MWAKEEGWRRIGGMGVAGMGKGKLWTEECGRRECDL